MKSVVDEKRSTMVKCNNFILNTVACYNLIGKDLHTFHEKDDAAAHKYLCFMLRKFHRILVFHPAHLALNFNMQIFNDRIVSVCMRICVCLSVCSIVLN